jgi:lysophospholipid acyltransferase (LPLAT)-like uncharacterized protein
VFRKYVLGLLVYVIYQSLRWTWRIQVQEPESMRNFLKNQTSFLIAFWHGDEIPLIGLSKRYRVATITSTSNDGEMMNTVIRLLGAKTVRGSSTRGAVNALKGIIRLAKQGYNASFAVDGPRGPIYKVKPGVFEVSRILSGNNLGVIFAGAVACDRQWVFHKAWNKALLPKPFAKVTVSWIEACPPVSKDQDPRSEELANQLAEALRNAKQASLAHIEKRATL